jgi:hypothetical protein
MRVRVSRWSAWAPGLEDDAAWARWCASPEPIGREGHPDASFLPAMLRRRCSPLARILLSVAFRSCKPEELATTSTVFASRHGNINESIEMLEQLAVGDGLSPTVFSHSVHNAQAGLFSIAAQNRAPSSSIAAQDDTFACGFVEAMTLVARDSAQRCLLVVGEVPLAKVFADLVDEPEAAYGLALMLERSSGDEGLRVSLGAAREPRRRPSWPDALSFLRFLLSEEKRFELTSSLRRSVWER